MIFAVDRYAMGTMNIDLVVIFPLSHSLDTTLNSFRQYGLSLPAIQFPSNTLGRIPLYAWLGPSALVW